MGELSPWHWLIVALVAFAIFGSRRLPDVARSLGRSMRIFTSEMAELRDGSDAGPATPAPQPSASTAVPPQPAPPVAGTGPGPGEASPGAPRPGAG